VIDRRLNTIRGASQGALLRFRLICSSGDETGKLSDEDAKPECLRLKGKYIDKTNWMKRVICIWDGKRYMKIS
jgi:hypothetical protein